MTTVTLYVTLIFVQDLNELYQKIVKGIREYEAHLDAIESKKLKFLVSARLILYRRKHGLTQEQMAKTLGVSRMEVIRWEKKLFEPREKVIRLLQRKGILDDLK